jgi:hypothetical protein
MQQIRGTRCIRAGEIVPPALDPRNRAKVHGVQRVVPRDPRFHARVPGDQSPEDGEENGGDCESQGISVPCRDRPDQEREGHEKHDETRCGNPRRSALLYPAPSGVLPGARLVKRGHSRAFRAAMFNRR